MPSRIDHAISLPATAHLTTAYPAAHFSAQTEAKTADMPRTMLYNRSTSLFCGRQIRLQLFLELCVCPLQELHLLGVLLLLQRPALT